MRPWLYLLLAITCGAPLALSSGCAKEMEAYPEHYAGIGVELEMEASGARVTNVLGGGSASAGGIRSDDLILKVNGESARGKSLAQVVEQLRGPVGTEVALTLRAHNGDRMVTLTRRAIALQSTSIRK